MKKIMMMCFVLFIVQKAEAQIQKGSKFISGAFSANTNDITNTDYTGGQNTGKNTYFNLSPSFGYYVSDKIAIGLSAGFNSNVSSYDRNQNTYDLSGNQIHYTETTKYKSMLYYIAPFVRYSHNVSEHLYCFGTFYVSAGAGPQKNSITFSDGYESPPDATGKQSLYVAGLNGGLNYFLNDHFAAMLSYGNISYSSNTSKFDDPNSTTFTNPGGSQQYIYTVNKMENNGFYFNFGLSSVGIGLQYFFNGAEAKK